jgi:hypothetical protein
VRSVCVDVGGRDDVGWDVIVGWSSRGNHVAVLGENVGHQHRLGAFLDEIAKVRILRIFPWNLHLNPNLVHVLARRLAPDPRPGSGAVAIIETQGCFWRGSG